MDFIELLFTVIIPGVAILFLCAVGFWMIFSLWKVWREIQSLSASKGNEMLLVMERLRMKAKVFKFAAFLFGIVGMAVSLYFELGEGVALLVGGGVFLFFMAPSIKAMRQYNENFKENIVKVELSKIFENLQYEPQSMLDKQALVDLNFFAVIDDMGGNDLIVADYKGIHFTQCDLRVREQYEVTTQDRNGKSRQETRWRDIFSGRAMQFDFAAKFRGRVQVVRRDFEGAKVKLSSDEWQKVETELAEFSEHFEVYAQDPLDAMAVLTPQMIEGIFYLNKALDVPTAFYFQNNTMFAFLELSRESFDVSGKRTLLEERKLLISDIALVTGFLETMYFKLQDGVNAGADRKDTTAAERAAMIAAAGPSSAEKLLRKTVYTSGKAVKTVWNIIPYVIIVVFLISAVYTVIELPNGIIAGTSADAMELPTLGYLAGLGAFVILSALSRLPVGYAMAIILLLIHMLFLSANLG